MTDHDPTIMRLVPRDGSTGLVTIHLPMSADKAARVMGALSAVGFEFEHVVRSEEKP